MKNKLSEQVVIHDRTQFEMRLDFAQDLTQKKNCYRVESYLFFPRSLRVDKQHYNKKTFYKDLKTNIRLKTPPVALNKLVDSDNTSSLKARIDAPFNRILSGRALPEDVDDIIYELKVFGTIFRGQVSDQVNAIISLIAELNGDVGRYSTICLDIQKTTKMLVKEISHALGVFRKLRAKFIRPTVPDKLNLVLEEINEFISLVVDTHLSSLALAVNDVPQLPAKLDNVYTKLLALCQNEASYRLGAGYLSGNPFISDGEKYIYRKSELKKTIMEVLFLRPKVKKEGNKTSQIISMVAAGLAMLWAAIAMIFGHSAFVINSTPFLFLMVFSYIVKDRIKDRVKESLKQRILSRFFHDRKIEFFNHKTKKPMGHIRESFQYVDKEDVPEDVMKARYPINSGKRFESVIKHDRVVTLFTKNFDQVYSQITNLTRLSIIIAFYLRWTILK